MKNTFVKTITAILIISVITLIFCSCDGGKKNEVKEKAKHDAVSELYMKWDIPNMSNPNYKKYHDAKAEIDDNVNVKNGKYIVTGTVSLIHNDLEGNKIIQSKVADIKFSATYTENNDDFNLESIEYIDTRWY